MLSIAGLLTPFAHLSDRAELIFVIEDWEDAKLQGEIAAATKVLGRPMLRMALKGQSSLRAETIERFSYAGVEVVRDILKIPANEIRMIVGRAGMNDVRSFLTSLRSDMSTTSTALAK